MSARAEWRMNSSLSHAVARITSSGKRLEGIDTVLLQAFPVLIRNSIAIAHRVLVVSGTRDAGFRRSHRCHP